MRFIGRSFVATFVLAFAWGSLTMAGAAHRRALGIVAQTDRGHIDKADAVPGADIYSCDALDTDEGGLLRVSIGANQLYLSASSKAALEDDGDAIQALATTGTVGFSFSTSGDLSVRTPAGIIRSAGNHAASGQVAFTSVNELMISATHGDLLLDNGGELRTIPEGKSARVTFEEDLNNGCHDESAGNQMNQRPYTQNHIGFALVAGAAVAIPAFFIWHSVTESDSTPAK